MKKTIKWLIAFSVLLLWTAQIRVDKSDLLMQDSVSFVRAMHDTPIRNFYMESGQEINLTLMRWLLYNTNFNISLRNYTFYDIIGDYELSREEEAYFVYVTEAKSKTYRKCLILRFLREHPEILARFPEIDNADSNIPMWKIDGINCLHTQGGANVGIFAGGSLS